MRHRDIKQHPLCKGSTSKRHLTSRRLFLRPISKTCAGLLVFSIAFTGGTAPNAASAQTDDLSLLETVICFFNDSRAICNSELLTEEEIAELFDRVTEDEEEYGALVQNIRTGRELIENGGDAELVDRARPIVERLLQETEDEALAQLPEETRSIVENCVDIATALNAQSEVVPGADPQDRVDALPDGTACTEALLDREREVAEQVRQADADIERLDEEIAEADEQIQNETDPERRRELIEERDELEREREERRRERERLERERAKLQQTRMLIGAALILAGLAAGGLPGLLMITNGMNMLSPSGDDGGSGDGGRSDHPTSGEVEAERETSTRQNQGSETPGQDPVDVPPMDPSNTEPDPAVVQEIANGAFQGGLVPVSPNRNSNGGYYLRQDLETGVYMLRNAADAAFLRRFDPSEIQPFDSAIEVPAEFRIALFLSLIIDDQDRAFIQVQMEDIQEPKVIAQNPGDRVGWFFADPNILEAR